MIRYDGKSISILGHCHPMAQYPSACILVDLSESSSTEHSLV